MQDFESIHAKLDKIQSDISDIKVLDAIQNEQLRMHMKRSDLLEERVEQVNNELKPIVNHITVIKGVMRILGGVGFVVGLVEAIRRIL